MSQNQDPSMSFSIHAVINSRRIKKNGTASIYLRVIINRQFKDIPLDISWHAKLWKDERCQPINKKCTVANDYNLIIEAAKAKAHEIFVQYRLRNVPLSIDMFMREYRSNLNRDDFLVYYRQKMLQRLKEREITASSVKSHTVTLNHLERWKKEILFSELNERTAIQFDNWLMKNTGANSINGKWGQHRNFKTYLNLAKKERIHFIHPYDYFTAKHTMGRFQPLTFTQFIDLWDAYQADWYNVRDREVVRAFLFACFTGMRHGDVRRMNVEWVDGDFIEFEPYKTRRHGTKVRVPATPEALRLLSEEVASSYKSTLFSGISEQKQNQVIRSIGKQIGFKGNLCFQVARETFATLYMENGGKLEVLASFLGHTSTKMSEKYIKIRDSRKREEADKISGFVKREN